MTQFENPSVAEPEFQDKRKRGRYVSEAALRFENLCVYEPSALQKKPSDSSEKTFQFLEEAFRYSEEAFQFAAESRRKRISERRSESQHHF